MYRESEREIFVCIYIYIYTCTCVCMCVYIYIYVYTSLERVTEVQWTSTGRVATLRGEDNTRTGEHPLSNATEQSIGTCR